MNILDNKQAYIGCAFLIIGLILQFLTSNEIAWVIGSLLIAFAPYGQYGRKKPKKQKKSYKNLKERKDDPNYSEKWCNVSREQLEAYVQSVNTCSKSGSGFISYFCGSWSLSRIIWAGLAIMVGIALVGDGAFQGAAIAFDSYFVLKLVANLYNGGNDLNDVKLPPKFNANAEGAESIFETAPNDDLFQLQPQAFMRNDNDDISLRDIRFNIVSKNRIPGLLCSMVAMTVNNVRYSSYPYHYLVFVFKGTALAQDASIQQALSDIAGDKSERSKIDPDDFDALDEFDSETRFDLDVKTDDGNSIFVILKSKKSYEAYTTNQSDCRSLMSVASRTMQWFDANRTKIEALSKT